MRCHELLRYLRGSVPGKRNNVLTWNLEYDSSDLKGLDIDMTDSGLTGLYNAGVPCIPHHHLKSEQELKRWGL